MATSSFLHNYKVSGNKAAEIKDFLNNPEKIPDDNKLAVKNSNTLIKKYRDNEALALKEIKKILSHF